MKKYLSKICLLTMLMATLSFTACSNNTEEIDDVGLSKSDDLAKHGVQTKYYEATFGMLNNSGVTATAYLSVFKDELTVKIYASGMVPDMPHPQHIHGFSDNSRKSTCPTMADDANGDGVLTLAEGLPSYGGVLLPLTPTPTAPDGMIMYEMTFSMEDQVKPLQNRAMVLHGGYVDGEYVATLPVACAQITVTPKGKN